MPLLRAYLPRNGGPKLPFLIWEENYVEGMRVIVHVCKSTVKYTYNRRNKEIRSKENLGKGTAVLTPNLLGPARSQGYILCYSVLLTQV